MRMLKKILSFNLLFSLTIIMYGSTIICEFDDTSKESDNKPELYYVSYRVLKNEQINDIAEKFSISTDTILSLNPQAHICEGKIIKIASYSGILYDVQEEESLISIASKYQIDLNKLQQYNDIQEVIPGSKIFIPGVELDWKKRQELNETYFKSPIKSRWNLSSKYGWRDTPISIRKKQRSFHCGIDMACPEGTAVYPSMDGQVIETGYNQVYGNYIILEHYSGYKSLYGHLKKIKCYKGNMVYTSTVIGNVGSTGLSTGPHLHFTVYRNGRTVNPLTLF